MRESIVNLTQLDALTANLNLIILPSNEHQGAIAEDTTEVPTAVELSVPRMFDEFP